MDERSAASKVEVTNLKVKTFNLMFKKKPPSIFQMFQVNTKGTTKKSGPGQVKDSRLQQM